MALGLATALVLGACGQTSSPPTAAPPTAASPTSASPSSSASVSPSSPASPSTVAGRRIDIVVTGKKVTPAPATVNLGVGESLTIGVTSDQANTLHAHGFEIAKELKAGQLGEVTIKGGPPGVYEFELHDPELRLFQVAVR